MIHFNPPIKPIALMNSKMFRKSQINFRSFDVFEKKYIINDDGIEYDDVRVKSHFDSSLLEIEYEFMTRQT